VRTESISGDRTEAVPGQPERDQEDQGGGAGNPVLTVQGAQPLSPLPDALGRRSRYDRRPDGGTALGAKCSPRGHLNQAAGASRQIGHHPSCYHGRVCSGYKPNRIGPALTEFGPKCDQRSDPMKVDEGDRRRHSGHRCNGKSRRLNIPLALPGNLSIGPAFVPRSSTPHLDEIFTFF
jgi:hypothetical protein